MVSSAHYRTSREMDGLVEIAGCIDHYICLKHDLTCDYTIIYRSQRKVALFLGAVSQRDFILLHIFILNLSLNFYRDI